jgi:Domain of unknown function (DUF4439)
VSATRTLPAPEAALQGCLAAEHAVLYGYGALGGVLARTTSTSGDEAYAQACYVVHRGRRDRLDELIAAAGGTPVAADPAYRLPFRVGDAGDCRRLARDLEHRSAAVYALAVAATTGAERAFVARALTDCALREYGWGGEPTAFPGL